MIFPTEAAYRAYLQDVKDFLWHEVDPLVPQIERDELIPFDMLRPKFRQHHLFDCLVPEAYGGLGLTTEQYAPVLKELAKVHGGLRAMLRATCSMCTSWRQAVPSSASAISHAWRRVISWCVSGSRNQTVAQDSTVNPAPVRQSDVYLLRGVST